MKMLLETVKQYEEIKKESEKLQSSKKYDQAATKFKEAEDLNNEYDRCLETWFKSRKNGGNNPSGMKKRHEIVLERCL